MFQTHVHEHVYKLYYTMVHGGTKLHAIYRSQRPPFAVAQKKNQIFGCSAEGFCHGCTMACEKSRNCRTVIGWVLLHHAAARKGGVG